MAAPTVDQLHAALIEVAAFLEERSLPGAGDVRRSADEVARSDAHGARRYLDLNRGRAPLDIYFSPVNGNAADDAEAEELQQRYDALSSRAASLADALLRAGR
jgi:hypothetical protein